MREVFFGHAGDVGAGRQRDAKRRDTVDVVSQEKRGILDGDVKALVDGAQFEVRVLGAVVRGAPIVDVDDTFKARPVFEDLEEKARKKDRTSIG